MPDNIGLKDQRQSRTFKLDGETLLVVDGVTGHAETAAGLSKFATNSKQNAIANGTILDGKYEVIDFLAAGGMGVVYKVRHTELNREEALKTFSTIHVDAESWSRFQREAKSIARLVCKNIVQVFDFGVWGAAHIPYYTMELLHGQSLAERVDGQGVLSNEEVVDLFKQIAFGLAHAHNLGIIHRDIKPANIFLCDANTSAVKIAKIVDFGVAKLAVAQDESMQSSSVAGIIFGSPFYMSPEQILSDKLDHRSDLYSLGCSLYEALTGHPPFQGATAFATLQMHLAAAPPALPRSITNSVQGQHLQTLVSKLLAKNPDDRIQTADEVVSILQKDVVRLSKKPERILPELSTKSRNSEEASGKKSPAALIFIALAILLCLIGGYLFVSQSKRVVATSAPPVEKTIASDSTNSTAEFTKTTALAEPPQTRPGYFSVVQADGSRIFHFPPGLDDSSLKDAVKGGASYRLKNSLRVGPDSYLTLFAGDTFSTNPQLFSGFRPNDLKDVNCRSAFPWNVKHLLEISKFKSLIYLELPGLNATSQDILMLNELPQLSSLDLTDCTAEGAGLMNFKRLNQLRILDINGDVGMVPILKMLHNSKVLADLNVRNCHLDDQAMKVIAEIHGLKFLKINDKTITDSGIKYLTKSPDLQNLRIGALCKITPAGLADAQKIQEVAIEQPSWSDRDFGNLKKILPKTNIVNETPNPLDR